EIFGRLTGVSLTRRVSDLIAQNSQSYSEQLIQSFREELMHKAIFGAIVDEGGDVMLKLKIERYGLIARDGNFMDIKPILEVRAMLQVGALGTIWQNSFNVPEYSNGLKKASLDLILEGRSGYEALFKSASQEVAEELVRRMH